MNRLENLSSITSADPCRSTHKSHAALLVQCPSLLDQLRIQAHTSMVKMTTLFIFARKDVDNASISARFLLVCMIPNPRNI